MHEQGDFQYGYQCLQLVAKSVETIRNTQPTMTMSLSHVQTNTANLSILLIESMSRKR